MAMPYDWSTGQTGVDVAAHKARHQDGGADEISVTGLSGLLADDQHVLDAEVTAVAVAHALATAVNDFLVASGSGAFVKKTLAETLTILGKALASGLASLNASSKVVQDPANATATPTASKIPIADGSGLLNGWVTLAGLGGVAKSLFDANTILKADSDNTPVALAVGEQTILGRKTSGVIAALSGADALLAMGISALVAELNYSSGVTSAIQTQLDTKLSASEIVCNDDEVVSNNNEVVYT